MKTVNISVADLVMPYFVVAGKRQKRPVAAMPGIYQFSVDLLLKDVAESIRLGIPAVLLFGVAGKRDARGSDAYNKEAAVPQAVAAITRRR